MLSLGPPFQPFCPAPPVNDRLPPFYLPPASANGLAFWVPNPKESALTSGSPEYIKDTNVSFAEQEAPDVGEISPKSTNFLDQKSMNGADNLRMTGSSNPRAEQLNWLAEVATGASRAVQNSVPSSPTSDKTSFPVTGQTTMLHNLDCQTPRGTYMAGTHPRMYGSTSYHPEHFPLIQQQQTTSVSGSGLSLYYSQAPRTAPYASFFHSDPRLPYAPGVTEFASANIPRLPRLYFQTELYPSNASLQSTHNQLPHSPGYLPAATNLSPVSLSPTTTSPRMPLPSRTILIDQSPEELTSQEREKIHLTHFQQNARRSSYKSPETVNSKAQSPAADMMSSGSVVPYAVQQQQEIPPVKETNPWSNSSSRPSYKVPTGKEGSLKHRILRPPSINITEPPATILDAPLSAPPIRSHVVPSPKMMRHESYGSYNAAVASVSVKSPTHTQPSQAMSPPPFVVPNNSSSLPSSSTNSAESGSPLKYPPAFMKGSIIQLANSQLKQVEHMTTEDFLECEALSPNLKIDSSTVVNIEHTPSTGSARLCFSVGQSKVQLAFEAPLEHPFFVFKQGWSSCAPERSMLRYRLNCHKLKVGDTCIFLTVKNEAKSTMTQLPKQVSIVPTSLKPQVSKTKLTDNNNSLESCKSEHDTSLNLKSSSCSTDNNTLKRKFILSGSHDASVVPSLFQLTSKNNRVQSPWANPSKDRKRRWSAPSEVAPD